MSVLVGLCQRSRV